MVENNSDNVMVRHTLMRGTLFLVFSSTLIISMVTPLELIDYLFVALSNGLNVAPFALIMVSDILLLIAGYLLASSLSAFLLVGETLSAFLAKLNSRMSHVNRSFNSHGLVSLSTALFIIAIWYVPAILNAALLQFALHVLMHESLLLAGGLIFVGFSQLSSNMRLLSYLLGCKAMAVFGAYLLVSPVALYSYFPYFQQAEAGAAMVGMCIASDATIIPLWLKRFFGSRG